MAAVTYREAAAADSAALAELRWRMEVERYEGEERIAHDEFLAAFVASTRDELARGAQRGWIAEADGRVVACALLIWWEMPPNFTQLRRRRGLVTSVYTLPEYRRQGVARRLMVQLVAEARALGVQRLVLWASDMARPLYEDLGFGPSDGLELNF